MAEAGRNAPRDPIPALAERDATGETAEIFADIRSTLGIGNVNLIWRHLATLDGALAWAWTAARPLYASGTAARVASEVTRNALSDGPAGARPRWSADDRRRAGLAGGADADVAAVLDAYNRGNALNLVALSALQAAPGERSGEGSAAGDSRSPPGPPRGSLPGAPRLPPLPELDAMTPEVREAVLALNRLGVEHPADIAVASLYKHLALWPGCLALAYETLAPLDADGALARASRALRVAAAVHASALAAELGPAPPGAAAGRARATLPAFTEGAICRMIPVGTVLRAALGDPAGSNPPSHPDPS